MTATAVAVAVAFDVGVGVAPTSAVGDGGVGAVAVVAAPSGRPSWWGRNSRRRSSLRWPPSIAEGVGLLVAALPQRVAVVLEPGKDEDGLMLVHVFIQLVNGFSNHLVILACLLNAAFGGGGGGAFC